MRRDRGGGTTVARTRWREAIGTETSGMVWVLVLAVGMWIGAPSASNADTVWQSFVNPVYAGRTAGLDLLVGTADDTPPDPNTTGFNSTGSLAHQFFLDLGDFSIPAAVSFTNELTDRSGTPLGSGGVITDFSVMGRGDDEVFFVTPPVQVGFPFFVRDVPSVVPHTFDVAPDGRSFHLELRQESCLDTDAGCIDPLAVIDYVVDGLVLLRGDDPTTAVANAPSAFTNFFAVWAAGNADVPAYLEFLESEAPQDWAAISLAVFAFQVNDGGNMSGQQAALVDGTFLVGVIPSYTVPEPVAGVSGGLALGVLGALARRRRSALGRS